MKLVFAIYSLQGGGAERILTYLANSFAKMGFHIWIMVFDNHISDYDLDEHIPIVVIDTSSYKSCLYVKRLYLVHKELKRINPDVVIGFTVSIAAIMKMAAAFLPCKIIGSERANPRMHSFKNKLIGKGLLPFCDGFIFQTEGARKTYPARLQKKSVVIPNPAPDVKNTWNGWNENHIKICSAGRLHEDKDFKTIIKAFHQFTMVYKNSSLTILGTGPQQRELAAFAQELNILDKINFPGFQSHVIDLLPEYTMFLFSSKAEGMPNVLLEALSTGIPCIATDCDFGPRELIQNGRNGWLVPVGDWKSMFDSMCWFMEHKKETLMISQNALKINSQYNKKNICQQYLKYIHSIKNKK